MNPQQNKYMENAIQTATPAQLLILLCDGAIRFCKKSIEATQENRLEDAHRFNIRVQDIISEFVITLDKNSPIAENLLKLYDYFVFRLIEANTKKSIEPIEEVMGYLTELRITWMEANKQVVAASKAGTAGAK